jgi:hypothetical protein
MTIPTDTPATSTLEPPGNRQADEEFATEIRTHHAAMVADLDRLTAALRDAAPEAEPEAYDRLTEWFKTVLVPHADEEETTTYHAAADLPEGALLIEAMLREHALIKRLVALFSESDGVAAATYGRAVYETFESHQRKENEVILPLLLGAPQVSLADVTGHGHDHHSEHDQHHDHDLDHHH